MNDISLPSHSTATSPFARSFSGEPSLLEDLSALHEQHRRDLIEAACSVDSLAKVMALALLRHS